MGKGSNLARAIKEKGAAEAEEERPAWGSDAWRKDVIKRIRAFFPGKVQALLLSKLLDDIQEQGLPHATAITLAKRIVPEDWKLREYFGSWHPADLGGGYEQR